MARKTNKWQMNSEKMMGITKNGNKLMGITKNGNKLMGMSENGKIIKFPKMIIFPKMVKMMGMSKKGKIPKNSENWINAGNFQKLNILG